MSSVARSVARPRVDTSSLAAFEKWPPCREWRRSASLQSAAAVASACMYASLSSGSSKRAASTCVDARLTPHRFRLPADGASMPAAAAARAIAASSSSRWCTVSTSKPSGPDHSVAAASDTGASSVRRSRQLTYAGLVSVHSGRISM